MRFFRFTSEWFFIKNGICSSFDSTRVILTLMIREWRKYILLAWSKLEHEPQGCLLEIFLAWRHGFFEFPLSRSFLSFVNKGISFFFLLFLSCNHLAQFKLCCGIPSSTLFLKNIIILWLQMLTSYERNAVCKRVFLKRKVGLLIHGI